MFVNSKFHSFSAPWNSSRFSATITRSSAYIIIPRPSVVLICLLVSVITMMKSNGSSALPCLKQMFIWNSFIIPDPTHPLVFSYTASTMFTSDSGAPIHIRVATAIFLGTLSNAFLRSTEAKAMFTCFSDLFSTSCLREKIPSKR